MTRMFKFVKKTWNPCVGCEFYCKYCWAWRMARRQKCEWCRLFRPHLHEERLNPKLLPKSGTVFVCDMGDIACQHVLDVKAVLQFIESFQRGHETVFFFETKQPWFYITIFQRLTNLDPKKTILSATIETNREQITSQVSLAPPPIQRYGGMEELDWPRKHVSVEPVMDFDPDVMFKWITDIEPELVSIGYDNYNNRLPEPPLQKVLKLIEDLENSGIRVERKTLREARK